MHKMGKYNEDIPDSLAYFLQNWEATAERAGFYMPALATLLRLAADEMADRYPDDTKAGASGKQEE